MDCSNEVVGSFYDNISSIIPIYVYLALALNNYYAIKYDSDVGKYMTLCMYIDTIL